MPFLTKKLVRIKYPNADAANNQRNGRLNVILIIFVLSGLIISGRLYQLQVRDHGYYVALASGQYEIFKKLYPVRGAIFFHDPDGEIVSDGEHYYPAAANKNLYLVFAVPKEIKDPEAALEALKDVFGLDAESASADIKIKTEAEKKEEKYENEIINDWQAKIAKKDDPYEPLKHYVPEDTINKIKQYNLEGIKWTKEINRYYPEKNIGGQLIGYVGKQAENNILKGNYGVEGCYDKVLAGEAGFLRTELDTAGRWMAIGGKDFKQAQDGSDIYLTIERSIQYFACNQLNKYVVQLEAEAGSVIVMEPETGNILVMCNSPDFDPNEYNEVKDISVFKNSAVSDSYEPGSVFKPITMAAALDSGKVNPFTTYYDSGEVKISGHTIMNSDKKGHGIQTMTAVLEQSLNTGAVFAARKVGLEDFKKYVGLFGFGKKTEIDLCWEQAGDIKLLNDKNEIYLATASFGQGISITPLQLIRAFGAIANQGKLVEPHVIEKIVSRDGAVIDERKPKVTAQVIAPETAKLLGSMLVSVVNNGHAKKARIPGYLVAGKTGTAQVPDLEKGTYSNKTIHTFAGFAPFNKPKFVAVVKMMNPKKAMFAESSAVPLFAEIAKFILNYYNIPPEEKFSG